MLKPEINITPLIDVLLVLLIILMVIAPLKPDAFKAKIPADRNDDPLPPDPRTLVVTVASDSSLSLNREAFLGDALDPEPLVRRLKTILNERRSNGPLANNATVDAGRPYRDQIERTVFIKAPRRLDYGRVARVVDAVKLAGAYPISLQIDHLD